MRVTTLSLALLAALGASTLLNAVVSGDEPPYEVFVPANPDGLVPDAIVSQCTTPPSPLTFKVTFEAMKINEVTFQRIQVPDTFASATTRAFDEPVSNPIDCAKIVSEAELSVFTFTDSSCVGYTGVAPYTAEHPKIMCGKRGSGSTVTLFVKTSVIPDLGLCPENTHCSLHNIYFNCKTRSHRCLIDADIALHQSSAKLFCPNNWHVYFPATEELAILKKALKIGGFGETAYWMDLTWDSATNGWLWADGRVQEQTSCDAGGEWYEAPMGDYFPCACFRQFDECPLHDVSCTTDGIYPLCVELL